MIKAIKKESGYFQSFDGTSIYYEVRGEGPPMVFCYGIACVFNHWTHQINHFSENYRTVMFDYRGHHKSDVPQSKENLSIDAISQDLLILCEKLAIKKAIFVAHSFGTQVVIEGYKRQPELFEKIVIVNGVYRNPFAALVDKEKILAAIDQVKIAYNQAPQIFNMIWKFGVQNPLLGPVGALFGGFNISKTALKDIEIYGRGVAAIDIRVFLTLFADMVSYNELQMLPQIKSPTLIISGSKDAITPIEDQRVIDENLPHSELFIVPYGSHCTQLDFPEMVNLKIQQFIER